MACLGSYQPHIEGTFHVKNSARAARVTVSSDGKGMVSQAGAVLLWETLRVTGLGRNLSQGLSRWRAPRAVHDPGKIVADLAAAVALGGDCLADIAVLREQPGLAGPVASDPVVSRPPAPTPSSANGSAACPGASTATGPGTPTSAPAGTSARPIPTAAPAAS